MLVIICVLIIYEKKTNKKNITKLSRLPPGCDDFLHVTVTPQLAPDNKLMRLKRLGHANEAPQSEKRGS